MVQGFCFSALLIFQAVGPGKSHSYLEQDVAGDEMPVYVEVPKAAEFMHVCGVFLESR